MHLKEDVFFTYLIQGLQTSIAVCFLCLEKIAGVETNWKHTCFTAWFIHDDCLPGPLGINRHILS